MNIFLVLFFLGLVQGVAEFLPISSSGHLVLFSQIFGVQESLFVSIILHVATLLSVCVVLRREVFYLLRHPFSKEVLLLATATIPTCFVALVLLPVVKNSFDGSLLPVCFLITALMLLFAEKKSKNFSAESGQIDFKSALFMGFMQGLATFPGISRSGATICAGILKNKNKEQVAKFSFLMSLPIILASLFMEIFEISTQGILISIPTGALIVSFVTAFLSGVLSLKMMIKFTSKSKFTFFSIYLFLISIVSLFVL